MAIHRWRYLDACEGWRSPRNQTFEAHIFPNQLPAYNLPLY